MRVANRSAAQEREVAIVADRFAHQVDRQLTLRGWDRKRLAQEAGMSLASVHRVLRSESPNLSTCACLAVALGCTFWPMLAGPAESALEDDE